MTFSIVIPTYNGEKYLEEAILSALRQNRKADEIIVYDDNSTGPTKQICRKYFPEVTYYFNHLGPSGFVNGWKKAIVLAKSDFIAILHQDDLLYPSFLEEAENALTLNPDVKHLFTLCDYIDENDLIINCGEKSVLKGRSTDKIIRYSGLDYVRAYQKKYNKMPHIHRCPGVITHRSIFDDGCNYNAEAGHIADDDFFYRIGQFTQVIGIMKSLGSFRIHKESETGRIGDVILVRQLATDYIYQVRQWQDSDYMGEIEMSYFEHYALKFVRRLFLYSTRLKDKNLKEKALMLYSEIHQLKFSNAHKLEHYKLETSKFLSSFDEVTNQFPETLKRIYKCININLIRGFLLSSEVINSTDFYKKRLIILAPHPDDEIFGLGGFIIQNLIKKCEINIIYLTDGEDSRTWSSKEEIKRQRISISDKVCKSVGIAISNINRLHLQDGSIPKFGQRGYDEAVRSIKELIDLLEPDAVFATHPLDYWPFDHVACAQIGMEAVSQSKHKTQLWYYWVWVWYNLKPWQICTLNFKKMYRVDIRKQMVEKIELKNLYLNSATPDGKPWSGLLPKALLKAFEYPVEIIERII